MSNVRGDVATFRIHTPHATFTVTGDVPVAMRTA